ncbi:MAG: VTT domain-containing protein [Chromatiaceae bacterium]
MAELFQNLLAWVSAHPLWAHLTVFLVALTESLAVVGLIVPGVIMMLGAGALIATGTLEFVPVCLWAVAGAIAGDGLSYWLGRYYKDRLRTVWPFSRHPETLDAGIRFFRRYGGKSIAFGRFVGPVRAVVPLVAGMLGMSPRRFLVANVVSAFAWAPAYLLPGIVFGASLELAAEAAARLVLVLLAVVGIIWLAAWGVRELFLFFSPHANRWVERLLKWADLHPKLGEVARALADSEHPDAPTLAALAATLILATTLFGLVTGFTIVDAPGLALNRMALDLALSLHAPAASYLLFGIGRLGGLPVILPILLVVYGYLRWKGYRRQAAYWLAAGAFALLAGPLLGVLLQVPRPDIGLTGLSPWSFPSRHVLQATVVYGFLAVCLAGGFQPIWRWLPYVAATVLVVAVALSELYFGLHWLTDVLGSITLGLAWVAALGLAFRSHTRRETASRGLSPVVLATVVLTFTLQGVSASRSDRARYRAQPSVTAISQNAWQGSLWRTLPQQREDIWQQHKHPLDVQYAGTLEALKHRLAPQGWGDAPLLAANNLMKLLSPSLSLEKLPVVPQVHDGRHEALALVKHVRTDDRLVLRLWATRYRVDPPGQPLWVGNVTAQRKEVILDWFVVPMTATDFATPFQRLLHDLSELGPIQPNGAGTPPVLFRLPPASAAEDHSTHPSAGAVHGEQPGGPTRGQP